jgi:aspartyl-tRNA(Asn)/glutamyl-tRNA(Gln) amidotransferase subunit A
MKSWRELDATALAASIRAGERSAASAVEEALATIDAEEPAVHAFLELDREAALARARDLDRARASGAPCGPLAGVPVALKANLCRAGARVSCGSRILGSWRAPYTATAVQRLLDAGAIPLGTTNMDEFAMGSSTENSAFGPTRNPWDLARTPGGSSGGSAAAVAAGMVPIALGSDTGGSVRQPAALCGIAGFKPTYGRVSRHGLVAFGSSLDQVSPFGRTVRDLELVLSVISGSDPYDSTCIDQPAVDVERRAETLKGLRIGLPQEWFSSDLDPRVRASIDCAAGALAELGAELVPVTLPHSRYAIATYYVIATAEASSNLARYDGARYGSRVRGDGSLRGMLAATREQGFGAEVKRRILLGTYVLSAGYREAWYVRALKVRRRIAEDFERAFETVDLIAGPTSPFPAFRLGDRVSDPVAMYLADVMTVPANLAGLPAVSVPCGFVAEGGRELPIGLQLVGRTLEDARVLRVARLFEESTPHRRLPAPCSRGAAS